MNPRLWALGRRDRADDERAVDELVWTWRSSCIGAGLHTITHTATGPTEVVPRLVDVTLGPPLVLIVELLPGQIVADVRAVAHRLAGPLGAVALRVEPRGLRHVRVECLTADPLLGDVDRADPVPSSCDPVMLGRDEQARPVTIALPESAHIVMQGASGSGKSTGLYGLLSQLVIAPDVMVVGSDITGLTLAPWAARPGMPGWCALGTRAPAAHVAVLDRLVDEMDDRIAAMPPGYDAVPITRTTPLIVAVLEEFAGLARLLATMNKDLEKRARAQLGRLFGESRKAGIRLVMISQRTDAAIVGSFERAQCSHGISFRTDGLAALAMLHADADKAIAAEHATARPGIALLSAPGDPLRRLRCPHTPYSQYYAEVTADRAAA